jgi:hypothetical protein
MGNGGASYVAGNHFTENEPQKNSAIRITALKLELHTKRPTNKTA